MSIMENAVIHRTVEGRVRRVVNKAEPVVASRDKILSRARELISAGIFRAQPDELCVGVITPISINRHFETMGSLYAAALEDEGTRAMALSRLMPQGPWPASDDCDRILRAIIVGRLPR